MALVSYIHNYHFEVIVGYVEEHILEVLKNNLIKKYSRIEKPVDKDFVVMSLIGAYRLNTNNTYYNEELDLIEVHIISEY